MNRPRLLARIRSTAQVHPICGLLNPRQAGKTTLARIYADKYYPGDVHFFDLENPADITLLKVTTLF